MDLTLFVMKECVVFDYKDIIEFIAVISAIISLKLYGDQWKYAGYFGLFSQIFWWSFSYVNQHNSMYVLCFFLTAMHIRNIWKMNQ